jgi:hypothetical protein
VPKRKQHGAPEPRKLNSLKVENLTNPRLKKSTFTVFVEVTNMITGLRKNEKFFPNPMS